MPHTWGILLLGQHFKPQHIATALTILTFSLGASVLLSFFCAFYFIGDIHPVALDYFRSGNVDVLKNFRHNSLRFTESEVAHFIDVYHLLKQTIYATFPLGIVLTVIALKKPAYIRHSKHIIWAFELIILVIGIYIYMDSAWKEFTRTLHPIFFPQGNWQFSSHSLIIQIYPKQVMQLGLCVIVIFAFIINECITRFISKVTKNEKATSYTRRYNNS